MKPLPIWIDGHLHDAGNVFLESQAPSLPPGEACYTSALVEGGRARWAKRHVARLLRDAATLGIPAPQPKLVQQAFFDLGRHCFGDGAGIVRLEVGASRLVGTPRPLGNDTGDWRASIHAVSHPGPGLWPGVKRSGDPYLDDARSTCRAQGFDETLLADAEGYVLEGSRSGLVVLDAEDVLATPNPLRGGVRSIALEILSEALPELAQRDIPLEALRQAREVVAVNAVRGARRIRSLDEQSLGTASGSGVAERLTEVLGRGVG